MGPLRLKGAAALIFLVLFLALVVALIVYKQPWRHPSALWISGLLWIALSVYWSAASSNSAQTERSESKSSRALHTNLVNIGLLLMFIPVPGLGMRWLPEASWVVPAGLAISALSLLLMIWARRHLGRNWSGEITKKVDHQLVRSGPYRLIRHPIYTGMLGLYLGTAMVAGRLHALVGFALAAIAYARKIPMEERNMGEIFGAEYDDYRRKSWALVPPVF